MYIYEIEVAAFHLDIFQSSQKSSQMSQVQDNCIQCGNAVRPRQQGLQCDGCDQWQYRKCNTGITQREYREAVQSEHAIILTVKITIVKKNRFKRFKFSNV